ncbi:MAG TPA: glycosyltransferase family 2 protein [Thermoanaerobaculia bacterium]
MSERSRAGARKDGEFRVIALVSAYNEADVISRVIGHLVENGVDIYLIDNRSTDDTVAQARPWIGRGLIEIEEFPPEPPPEGETLPFDWTAILQRKEELAAELPADWFLHHDADEFREAPWPGVTLKEAIRWVDRLGYNCLDFRVYNFPPTDDRFRPGDDPREHFRYWEEAGQFDRGQLKGWKKRAGPVSLVPSGGHEVGIPDRRVFPIPFLLRHYPIRGQDHGRRKVFGERRGRFVDRERARRWHIQYDEIVGEDHDFLADPAKLRPWDADQARLELLLDNAVTRHEKYLAGQANLAREGAETERQDAASLLAALGDERAKLEADRALLRQRAADLEALAGERERRNETIVERLGELERALGREEGRAAELARRVEELESRRGN